MTGAATSHLKPTQQTQDSRKTGRGCGKREKREGGCVGEWVLDGVIQRLKPWNGACKSPARVDSLSCQSARQVPCMIRPVREPRRGTGRGGDDLMLNHLPPFPPLRGLSDTPTGPQYDTPWRHGSRRTGTIGTLDVGSLVSGKDEKLDNTISLYILCMRANRCCYCKLMIL